MTVRVMARRRSHPAQVGDALRQVVQRIDPDRRLAAYRVWTFWADAVGPAVAAHAEPAAYRDGVLSVRVAGAAWMQELQFMQAELRARLNARLGTPLIRDIYFVSGAVSAPRRAAAAAAAAEPTEPAVDMPPIKDPRLHEVLEHKNYI
jgi:predicted nucleic acid-binding Zn ribbon protein